jgi:hypothetical protein
MTLQIGFLLFPKVQQLDLTGPFEVFASLPCVQVHLVAATSEAVTAATGLRLLSACWPTPTLLSDFCTLPKPPRPSAYTSKVVWLPQSAPRLDGGPIPGATRLPIPPGHAGSMELFFRRLAIQAGRAWQRYFPMPFNPLPKAMSIV